ncbi:hypothetical protein KW783_01380 [Candidatus Parcubacteria bacterium]|nr:hypothetical protein [Candidatus Parcubacteria bacterium]
MHKDIIHNKLQEFLNMMGISVQDIKVTSLDAVTKCRITTRDSGALIGHRGEHLSALTYLAKRIISKHVNAEVDLFVDVNNYQEENIEKIKTKARMMAERARQFQTSIEFEPMSAFERKVVHTLFEGNSHFRTESRGEGKDRRVLITYVEQPAEEKF